MLNQIGNLPSLELLVAQRLQIKISEYDILWFMSIFIFLSITTRIV